MSRLNRLYVEHGLTQGQSIPLTQEQAHYLFSVMRLDAGDQLLVINGHAGEWLAKIAQKAKRGGEITLLHQARAQQNPPDLWLCFAPIKKARTDFIVEKAAELGVAELHPMHTAFTNSERINRARLQAHVIEAIEQCGGTFVPPVHEVKRLRTLLDQWPEERSIIFCDETKVDLAPDLDIGPGPSAIFIGPEGGFSEQERQWLRAHPKATSISLGPRILRADTAAAAAITLWQSRLGDWT